MKVNPRPRVYKKESMKKPNSQLKGQKDSWRIKLCPNGRFVTVIFPEDFDAWFTKLKVWKINGLLKVQKGSVYEEKNTHTFEMHNMWW